MIKRQLYATITDRVDKEYKQRRCRHMWRTVMSYLFKVVVFAVCASECWKKTLWDSI